MSCLLKSEVKWIGKQLCPQWPLALLFSHKLLISFTSEHFCITSQHVCGYWGWNQEDHKLLEKLEKISTLLAQSICFFTTPLVSIIHLREFKFCGAFWSKLAFSNLLMWQMDLCDVQTADKAQASVGETDIFHLFFRPAFMLDKLKTSLFENSIWATELILSLPPCLENSLTTHSGVEKR